MSVRHEALLALRDKYREIQRLRQEQAAGSKVDPTQRLRALAARFPGALRELDALCMEEVAARLAALEAALALGPEGTPAWAPMQLRYHGWMRLALRVKGAWLRLGDPKREPTPQAAEAVVQALRGSYPAVPGEPTPDDLDAASVADLVRPPGGRLNPWVYSRVAAELGCAPGAVQGALFGPTLGGQSPGPMASRL